MSSSAIDKFEAVQHRRLAIDIADQIERLVLSRELAIGDALPAERELAEQLEVSRNILREAISMLVQKGLVEVRPGSGTFIARPSSELLGDTLTSFIRFNSSGLLDLVEARRSLEVEITALAAERATEADRAVVEDCLKVMDESVDDLEAYIEADIRFHQALAVAADNEILYLLLDSIRGAMRENIRTLATLQPGAVREAAHHHRAIAEALELHDPGAAREAMRGHLEGVERGLRELDAQGAMSSEGPIDIDPAQAQDSS
ncbi:MAG: FCD domain-containing protein [Proteobacteria bacterium]|nr:FCD domain-containing protein [Pseudomonadota bacterium]